MATTERLLDNAWSYFANWRHNTGRAVSETFTSLTLKDYIRLVWVICGYCMLRPYLEAGFRKLYESGQAKEEKKKAEQAKSEAEAAAAAKRERGEIRRAKMSANDLRGISTAAQLEEEEDDEEEEEAADTSVPQWGRGARLRQKKALRLMEKELQRLKDQEDDKDIEEFLED